MTRIRSEFIRRMAASQSQWSRSRRAGCAVIILFSTLLLMLISGEIAIRIYHSSKYRHVQTSVSTIKLDEELGWIPNPDFIHEGFRFDAGGQRYFTDVRNDQNGFRLFGNPEDKNKTKVLFLGDSYTHAVEVSREKSFFGILKERFFLEVFALGVGGYSNLQEYMMLDMHIDTVRPDIVILQLHTNDFINNHYELELKSKRSNNGMRRPYLTVDGHIMYATPKKFSIFRDVVNKHFRFIYFVVNRLDILRARGESVEDRIKVEGISLPVFRESVEITEKLLLMIKTRIPAGTDLYVFCADDERPSFDEMKKILKNNDISFIDGVAEALSEAEQNGVIIRSADGAHWNEEAHRIVAGVLEKYLSDRL